ncbi:MAG TPA: alpha/beta hydrolase [Pirellulales bacterium]|jgi:acetyl esterase/lipase|nr:alpha/beta hydrolase [Pirellulales bacterium]
MSSRRRTNIEVAGLMACLLSAVLVLMGSRAAAAEEKPAYDRTEDVIYGRKFGTALTLDVFRPKQNANGAAVIWTVSGGWFSSHEAINLDFMKELIGRGYTVFAVVHGSQPKYTIPEAVADMNLAVRFIRAHAADYKIDPNRIGISGGSAGGHLSLMQGTAADTGDPDAKDAIARTSSRVQAVACFFPPTDFLNYGTPGYAWLNRGPKDAFKPPFDFYRWNPDLKIFEVVSEEERVNIARQISPVYHVTSDDPPTLIIHGDKDALVPLQQSELIIGKLKEAGVPCELVVKHGAGHGWAKWDDDMRAITDWFDKYLKAKD